MYLVQILLPLSDNDGRRFPRTEFDRIKSELADRYSGVTAYLQAPAEGLWQHDAGHEHDDTAEHQSRGDEGAAATIGSPSDREPHLARVPPLRRGTVTIVGVVVGAGIPPNRHALER